MPNKDKKDLKNKPKHQTEEYIIKLKYLQAEFDNYRKYIEKNQKQLEETSNEKLIKSLIPVIDDFEATLKNIKNEKTKEGIQILFNNFYKILETYGLKKMPAKNDFDPYYHEAIMREKRKKEGLILEEIQKGYMFNSKIIRHAKVKVSY